VLKPSNISKRREALYGEVFLREGDFMGAKELPNREGVEVIVYYKKEASA
jgi:hypothetical protein